LGQDVCSSSTRLLWVSASNFVSLGSFAHTGEPE